MTTDQDTMYEFKGNTSAKLDILFSEIKALRKDVDTLKQWKAWVIGVSAAISFAVGLLKDYLAK